MKLRWSWVLGLCMLAAGCALTARPTAPRQYTLAAAATTTAAAVPQVDAATLQIARIEVPAWLDGTAMYYRLAYTRDAALAAYTESEWAAPPGGLLAGVLQRALARTGDWRVVAGPGTPVQADAVLYVRLDDFSQVFGSPHESAGVLDATATLLAGADGHAVAQRHFHVEIVAHTPDAPGGVTALDDASREFAQQVSAWLVRLPKAGAPSRSSP